MRIKELQIDLIEKEKQITTLNQEKIQLKSHLESNEIACQKITFSCNALEGMANAITMKVGEQQSQLKKSEEDKRQLENYLGKLVRDIDQLREKMTELKKQTEYSLQNNKQCKIFCHPMTIFFIL